MTIDDQIRDEKLKCDINREAAKILALSSDKIDKYESLTGQEILLSNQKQIIKQAKFTYSPLGKAFEKQIKTIEDQGKKQVDALKDLHLRDQRKSIEGIFPKGNETEGIKDELSKIKRYENKAIRDNLFYDLSKQPFDFRIFVTIRSLGDDIYNKRVNIDQANQEQSNLFDYLLHFDSKTKPKSKKEKKRKNDVFDSVKSLYKGRELVINAFRGGLFPLKSTTVTGLKILTPKQMLQRLPIPLAQVKAGNNSKSLLNEIRQIVYSLYQSKGITRKVYNSITNSIQLKT